MLENRIILTAVIGEIIGIIWGLYCKISIVPIYLLIYIILKLFKKESSKKIFKLISFRRYFRYVKIIFCKKVIHIIIIFSCISNLVVLYQNYKYENLYKDIDQKEIELTGIILSQNEKTCKVKINKGKYKNTYIYLKSNVKLNYGDEIKFSGKFSKPSKRTNYKGFDYSNYLKGLKIYGSVNCKNINIISKNNVNIILKNTNKLANKLKQIMQSFNLKEDEKAILEGILLGDKENIPEEIINDFSKSNISHILAISGMHVSYIILFSNFIFNKTIGKHKCKLVTSIIIIIYMFITSFTPSVVRAGITGIIMIMSNYFYRKNDIWESLGIALFLILTYTPFLISNIGLLLSFAGTIGIVVFNKVLDDLIDYHIEKIKRTAIRKNKVNIKFAIKIMESKIFKIIRSAILVTISATLMVFPIVLIYFNKVSVTSLIVSVISSFIIGPIVILGLISIIVNFDVIQKMLSILLKTLITIANLGSKLPLNQVYLVTPSIAEVLIYYILIFGIFFYIKINLEQNKSLFQKRIKNLINLFEYKIKLNKKKIVKVILVIAIGYLVILKIPKDLKIYFIDVGQGDCTLIKTPLNQTILIDGGGSENEDYNVRGKNFDAIFIR